MCCVPESLEKSTGNDDNNNNNRTRGEITDGPNSFSIDPSETINGHGLGSIDLVC